MIALKLEGLDQHMGKVDRKTPLPEIRRRHRQIITLEDQLRPLESKQPSPATEKLRKTLRLREVAIRSYLPEPTTEEWDHYAETLHTQRTLNESKARQRR